jgi:dihydrofolate reductase
MRKVIVTEFLSLDGVMQSPGYPDEDREGGFEHGGWQQPYFDEMFGEAVTEGFSTTDGLLLGRKTYEIFAAHWPNAPQDDPIAPTINGFDKFVASNSLDEVEWVNSSLIKGDLVEEVTKLKQQPGKDLRVIGSGELVRTLMDADLVDEYQLMIHPIVLGSENASSGLRPRPLLSNSSKRSHPDLQTG